MTPSQQSQPPASSRNGTTTTSFQSLHSKNYDTTVVPQQQQHFKCNFSASSSVSSSSQLSSSLSASMNTKQSSVYVLGLVALYQITYCFFYYVYEKGYTQHIFGLTPMSVSLCQQNPSNEKCGRSDMFAFQSVAIVIFLVLGIWSVYEWHFVWDKDRSIHQSHPKTALGRFYGHHTPAQWMTYGNAAYQVWDFIISWTIPEYCTIIMMTHHVVAAMVGLAGIYNHMLGYYALFFMGLTEVSSIFLVLLDVDKYFALQNGSWLQLFHQHLTGPLFVFTFILYRVILWWPCTFQMYRDAQEVISTGKSNEIRPGRDWIIYMWVILVFPMGLLQLYWLKIILETAFGMIQ